MPQKEFQDWVCNVDNCTLFSLKAKKETFAINSSKLFIFKIEYELIEIPF